MTIQISNITLQPQNEEQPGLGKYTYVWTKWTSANTPNTPARGVPTPVPTRYFRVDTGDTWFVKVSFMLTSTVAVQSRWLNFHTVAGYPGAQFTVSPLALDLYPIGLYSKPFVRMDSLGGGVWIIRRDYLNNPAYAGYTADQLVNMFPTQDNYSSPSQQWWDFQVDNNVRYDFTVKYKPDSVNGLLQAWVASAASWTDAAGAATEWVPATAKPTAWAGDPAMSGGQQWLQGWVGGYESVASSAQAQEQYLVTADRYALSEAGARTDTPTMVTTIHSAKVSGGSFPDSSGTVFGSFNTGLFGDPGGTSGVTAPVNTAAPAVTGTLSQGSTLSCSTGSWTQSPSSYSYQWKSTFDGGVTLTDIGTNSSTYALTSAEVGKLIRCVVTATNTAGSGSATSNTTTIVDDGAGSYIVEGTFETTIGVWGAQNATLTRDTTQHHSGVASLKVVTPGSAGFEGAYWGAGRGANVAAGAQRQAPLWVMVPTGNSLLVKINNFDSAGASINNFAVSVSGSSGVWQQAIPSGAAPTGAAYQQISITTGTTTQAMTFYVDDVSLTNAASTTLALVSSGASRVDFALASKNQTITVPTNANLLVVGLVNRDNADVVNSMTFDSVAMTDAGAVTPNTGDVTFWYIKNPTTGSAKTLAITLDGSTHRCSFYWWAFEASDATTPVGTITGTNGTGTSASRTVSSSTRNIVLDLAYILQSPSPPGSPVVTNGQTVDVNGAASTSVNDPYMLASHIAGAATTNVGWSWTGSLTYVYAALEVKGITVPAPTNSVAPAVTGTATEGNVLTATNGTWANSPTSFALQWWRDTLGDGVFVTAIPGATGNTYTIDHADVGSKLRVTVTATNAGGSASANSAATSVVAAAIPVNVIAPNISQFASIGFTILADPGIWLYSPNTYAYQWQRAVDAAFTINVTSIGTNTPAYTQTTADLGRYLRVQVTATNAAGTSSAATSNVVGPVPVTDDFNRADENPALAPWGPPVLNGIPRLKIAGNKLMSSSGSISQSTRTDVFAYDATVTVTVKDLPTTASRGIGLYVRVRRPDDPVNASGYVFVYLLGSGFAIFEFIAGNIYNQLTSYDTSHVLAASEQLQFDAAGTVLTGYWVDAAGVRHSVASVPAAESRLGTVAVELNDPVVSVDDFDVQVIAVPPPPFGTYDTAALTTLETWIDDREVVFRFPYQPVSQEEAYVLDSLADVFSITKT